MKCKKCGEILENGEMNCSNCGEFIPQQLHPFCIMGLVAAVVSILYNPYGILSAAGIALSVVGLKKIKGTRFLGKGISVAGIIVGIVTAVWLIAVTILDYYL